MTEQRKVIYEVIQNSCLHMTAEEIFLKAKEIYPSLAMGTVYRNLGLMTNANEIQKVIIPGEPDRYDKNPEFHHHAKCVYCGRVEDVMLDDLKEEIKKQTGLEIVSYELGIRYICRECADKNRNTI